MPFRRDKDKDAVTRRELRIALNERVSGRSAVIGKDSLTFDGFHNAAALTDSVVDDIILNRPAPGEFKTELGPSEMGYDPCGKEAITQAELDGALVRLHYSSRLHADKLFRDALAHREPVWRGGDVVKDSDGVVWVRAHGDKWLRPGNTAIYHNQAPRRPLKRLVEGT